MKMKDELEEFVRAHRAAFDKGAVDKEALWSRIDKELSTQEPKVVPIWKRTGWQVAASVVILLGGLFLFYNGTGDGTEDALVNKELLEVDTYYGSLVNDQVELIRNHPSLTEEERQDFLLLSDELDAEYNRLRLELQEGINDKKIMKAIINNYRKKIELMEKLLENSYPTENEHDETEYIF